MNPSRQEIFELYAKWEGIKSQSSTLPDSLTLVEMVVFLEEELSIVIPNERIAFGDLDSPEAWVELIRSLEANE